MDKIRLETNFQDHRIVTLVLTLSNGFVPEFVALIMEAEMSEIKLERCDYAKEVTEISTSLNQLQRDEARFFLDTIENFAASKGIQVVDLIGGLYDFVVIKQNINNY